MVQTGISDLASTASSTWMEAAVVYGTSVFTDRDVSDHGRACICEPPSMGAAYLAKMWGEEALLLRGIHFLR
jgi:hypothetical protein